MLLIHTCDNLTLYPCKSPSWESPQFLKSCIDWSFGTMHSEPPHHSWALEGNSHPDVGTSRASIDFDFGSHVLTTSLVEVVMGSRVINGETMSNPCMIPKCNLP